jgi:thioesterase domain-containing protein/acyl carrier protein
LLAAYAAAHLPTAAIPTRWALVEEFKLTERGKLDRRHLPEPLLTASTHVSSDPPATDTEKWLARSWSGLLGIQTIGRDESFFELGGHSLAALQLFAGIAREWKIRIPMSALIQAPTPRMLGDLIDRQIAGDDIMQDGHSIIVSIRPAGHLPPLFCIHGGDGGVFFYRDLAELLPPGRPLFAIESPSLASKEKVQSVSVEETAAKYVAALLQQQPTGPFYLLGYSYGGLLVFEIARLILAKGHEIAFVGLCDTINPAESVREYTLMERARVFWNSQEKQHWIRKAGRLLERVGEGVCTHLQVRKQRYAARSSRISEPHSETRMLQVREAHLISMNSYQPSPLGCHVTLFKSKAPDDKFDIPDDYGWSSLAKSLEVIEVEGRHLTIFSKNHVGVLAREITERL